MRFQPIHGKARGSQAGSPSPRSIWTARGARVPVCARSRARYDEYMKRAAPALAVALFALAALFGSVLRHPQYTPDGIVYARFAAHDAGYSERDSTMMARAFYARTPLMREPRYRALVVIDPSRAFDQSRVLADRVLYPWVAARFLPVMGFRALFAVSAAAYLAFGVALFWELLAFGRPWLAALLACAALALPLVRNAAASDLTDVPALLWWTLALGALLRAVQERRAAWPIVAGVASILLVLTRPTPYLTFLPAAAAAVLAGSWPLLAAALAGVAAFGCVAFVTHAFGASEQLRWIYLHGNAVHGAITERAWYRGALLDTLRYSAAVTVRSVIPLLANGALIVALRQPRTRNTALVLIAAGIACLAAIPFNPVPSAIARVVFLPLVPVFCASLQCAAAAIRVPSLPRQRGAAPDTAAIAVD